MKVTMIMVSSVNGKITKNSDPHIYSWTSEEDKKLFFSQIKKNNLIVMGSGTYNAAKNVIKLSEAKLRVILTKNPQKYEKEAVPNSLEFTKQYPGSLVSALKKRGYENMLLAGGGEINALFLKARLVDEIHLTVEPLIFGKGKNLVADNELDIKLRLIDIKKLNDKGTILLKYKVVK